MSAVTSTGVHVHAEGPDERTACGWPAAATGLNVPVTCDVCRTGTSERSRRSWSLRGFTADPGGWV